MKKRNLLCSAALSAALSVVLAVGALPCSVSAEEVVNSTKTEAAAENTDTTDNGTAENSDNADNGTADAGSQAKGTVDTTGDASDRTSESGTQSRDNAGTAGQGSSQGSAQGQGSKTSTTSSVQTVDKYDYDITVTFTKQRGTLTDISVTSDTSGKNNKYTTNALAGIADQLKNGSGLDSVSGATYSSNAIIAAIKEAGDYDSVSENLTASLNGTAASSSQSSQSGSGQGESGQSGKGESGSDQGTQKTVPANYITYTVTTDSDGHKVAKFQLSDDAKKDNTYVNMVLIVDDNGKHFMPVDAGSDESGNANDFFAYQADDTAFTVLNDDLTSIEVIFTSDEYGKVHFTADLTAATGGNEEGSGAKEDDPKGGNDQETEDQETEEGGNAGQEEVKTEETDEKTDDGDTDEEEAVTDTDADSDIASDTAETTAEDKTAVTTTSTAAATTTTATTAATTGSTVQTGDSISLFLFSALALISALGLIAARKFRKA